MARSLGPLAFAARAPTSGAGNLCPLGSYVRQAHAPRSSSATEAELTRHLFAIANVFGTSIWIALLAGSYGKPHFWLLLPAPIVATAVNIHLVNRGGLKLLDRRAETLRAAFNIALHVTTAILCEWSLPSLLWIPFLVGISTPFSDGRVAWPAVATLTAFGLAGLLTGAPIHLVAFLGAALFLHLLLLTHQRFSSMLLRENRQAHLDLEAAQRLAIAQEKLASIGQIAAGVAHEINNPMCFVTANLQDLLHELRAVPALPSELIEFRDEVLPETVSGVARVNSIVDDLRRFARGEPELPVSFDLSHELRAAVRIARTQLRSQHSLSLEPLQALPMRGMPRQLCQVMLNLLLNGLQALRERGEVRVSAVVVGSSVQVAVADNGVGMSDEARLHLFEPFYTTKAGTGTGLGLALVRSIVQEHEGTITVDSEPGRGTTFVLTLPLAPEPDVTQAPAAPCPCDEAPHQASALGPQPDAATP